MGKLLTSIISVIGALWLGIAGAWGMHWYDSRPAGVPAPIVLRVLWFHRSLGLPESLAAQRDDARAALKIAQGNVAALQLAVNVQNASIAATEAAGRQAMAAAENDVTTYRRALARARSGQGAIFDALHAVAPGDSECTKAQAVDLAFVRSLQP